MSPTTRARELNYVVDQLETFYCKNSKESKIDNINQLSKKELDRLIAAFGPQTQNEDEESILANKKYIEYFDERKYDVKKLKEQVENMVKVTDEDFGSEELNDDLQLQKSSLRL